MGRRAVSIRISDELYEQAQASGRGFTDFLNEVLDKGSQAFKEGAAGRPVGFNGPSSGALIAGAQSGTESPERDTHEVFEWQRECFKDNEPNKKFRPANLGCDSCGYPRAWIDPRAEDLQDRLKDLPECPRCHSTVVKWGAFELSREEAEED